MGRPGTAFGGGPTFRGGGSSTSKSKPTRGPSSNRSSGGGSSSTPITTTEPTAGEILMKIREEAQKTGQNEFVPVAERVIQESKIRSSSRGPSNDILTPETLRQINQGPQSIDTELERQRTTTSQLTQAERRDLGLEPQSKVTRAVPEQFGFQTPIQFAKSGVEVVSSITQPIQRVGKPILRFAEENPADFILLAGGTALTFATPFPGDEAVVGGAFATRLGLLGRGAKAAKTASTVAREVGVASRIGTGLRTVAASNRARQITVAGGTLATSLALPGASRFVSRQTAPSEQKIELQGLKQQNINFADIVGAGLRQQQQSTKGPKIPLPFQRQVDLAQIVQEFPGGFLLAGEQRQFETGVRQELQRRGVTNIQRQDILVQAALRERGFLAAGEAGSFVGIGAASEITGRALLSGAGRKLAAKGATVPVRGIGTKLFTTAAPRIAAAGVLEGAAGEISIASSRRQELTPGRLAIGGITGGISAGLIGGAIAGTRIRRPALSQFIETSANIIDPFEFPGDVTASGILRGTRTRIPSLSVSLPSEQRARIGVAAQTQTRTTQKTPTRDSTPTIPAIQSPFSTIPLSQLIPGFTVPVSIKTPTPTPTAPLVPNFVPQFTPTPVSANITIPAETETPVQTPTPVPTPVGITSPISIPTVVPQALLPPLLPLGIPASGGGFGRGSGRGLRLFRNELAAGAAALGRLTGGIFGPIRNTPRTKQRKK